MEIFSKGLDLTEEEFDLLNAEKSEIIRSAPDFNDELFTSYASKNCPTEKGFWMQIVEAYLWIFTHEEIAKSVPYLPKN